MTARVRLIALRAELERAQAVGHETFRQLALESYPPRRATLRLDYRDAVRTLARARAALREVE